MRRRVLPPRSGEGLRPVPFPRGGPRRRRGSPPSLPRRALRPASPFPATQGPLAPSLPRSGRPFRRPVLRRGCWPRRPRVRGSWGLCPRPEASPAGAKPPSPATPYRPRFGGGGSAPWSPGHCLLSRLPGSRRLKLFLGAGVVLFRFQLVRFLRPRWGRGGRALRPPSAGATPSPGRAPPFFVPPGVFCRLAPSFT